MLRWIIKNRREYIRTLDTVTGDITWTKDKGEAQLFGSRETARQYADGIGTVILVRTAEVVN